MISVLIIAFTSSALSQAPQEARVVEEIVIRSDDSSPDRTLNQVAWLTVLSDGSIAFADPSDRRVRMYDSSGRFLRVFGRTGEGPGEIMTIREFGSVADTLWIYDQRSRQFNFYQPDGTFIRSAAFETTGLPGTHAPRAMLHGGRVLLESTFMPQLAPGAPRVGNVVADSSVFRVLAPGVSQPLRIFARPRAPAAMIPFRSGDFQAYTEQPLIPRVLTHVSSGARHALVTVDPAYWGGPPGRLRVHELRADGTITVIDLAMPAVPVTPALADDVRTMKNRPLPPDADAQQRTDRASMLAALREHLYVPQHAPLAIQVVAGSDGSIWVRDAVLLNLWRVVINGRIAHTVTLPAGVAVRQATTNRIWAVRSNADGVPEIVRYAVYARNANDSPPMSKMRPNRR